jgi:predicted permease
LRDLASDVRAALRVFRTSPGHAAAVIVTLALGMGANATIFGAVDRVLLSPPEHVQDHEELRLLHLTGLGPRSRNSPTAYSFPDYESIRGLPALAGAAAYRNRRRVTMGSGLEARRALVQDATAELFPLLGVVPALGRFFDADDDRPGAPPVAVLSHAFWDRELGRDPDVIGRLVRLASHTYEVIGVAPRGFTGAELEAVDVWVPLRMNVAMVNGPRVLGSRGAWWFRVVVRLRKGVTDEEAEAQMTAAHAAGVGAEKEAGGEHFEDSQGAVVRAGSLMTALGPNADTDTAITLWLAGVSILVLLIACANVANLMLARGIDRQRERAVRLAFGIGRRRLISQALTEALVLAVAGGLAAVVVAQWSGRALYELLLPGIPLPNTIIGTRLVGFLGVVVVATTVIAGVLPALQALRTAPGDVLRAAGRGSTRGGRARGLLTLGQVSLSAVLLVGAGLFIQSLQKTLEVDPGYDHESLIVVEFEQRAGVDATRRDALYREALESLTAMPGIERAVLSSSGGPLLGWDELDDLRASHVDTVPRPAQGGPYTYAGTEGYAETAGLRIVRGRAFEPAEYAAGVPAPVMVSRSFAEAVWPGLDPLQECVQLGEGALAEEGPEPCRPVIGVYEDIMHSIGDDGLWSLTWPLPLAGKGLRGMLIRVEDDPAEMVRPIRERLAALSGDIRYVHVNVLASRMESMRGPWRVGATLFTAFGVLALIVASLGLYSVLSFSVARSSREIGIRSALGARRRNLVAMVVARAARLVGAGLLVGIGIAVVSGRLLQAVLFGVPAVNPVVFGVVAVVLVAAGLLAAWIPARKATAIDPVRAMAAE